MPSTRACPRHSLPLATHCPFDSCAVQVGDKVLLPEYGGHTVKMGEAELHLYREEDILGKFDAELK